MTPRIAIVTIKDDIHAYAIRHAIHETGRARCHLLEVDRLSATHHMNWNLDDSSKSFIRADDENIKIEDFDVLWWRRSRSTQSFDDVTYPTDQEDVINNDCRATSLGLFITHFRGKWISHPFATEQAGNKLNQLSIAHRAGFRVPKSLITQCPKELREFCDSMPGKVVVKTVAGGGRGLFLFTQFVDENVLNAHDSIRVAPAIYQEYIEGTKHIRLNIFGGQCYAGLIDSPDLDWRPNLNVPVSAWDVPPELETRARSVLNILSLEMGVIDLKLTPSGDVVWLEINPQGQFLFLEPLTGTPYTDIFARYLIYEAEQSCITG